jgi:PadR family transcriptional regulator, regulatory protein PadR
MARTNSDQLHGTLDLLVLRTLIGGPQHGYGIAQRLHQLSAEVLQVEEGSLYPALYRMEQKGWIASEWAITDMNRRARYYRLTRSGRKQVEAETGSWQKLSAAIDRIIAAT